jgi:anti-sigma regulatory factor (Ser/Thr protein kinase)
MPYYRCPECGLTAHSVAGRFTRNVCPNCSAPLASSDQIFVPANRPAIISRRLVGDLTAAEAARRELETILWDLDADEYQVLALLVSELVGNSVKHSGAAPGGEVRLDVSVGPRLVRVEVRDQGRGFEPVARTEDSPLDSHWGLHLVEELTDRWEVVAGNGTLVWFELDRSPGPDPYLAAPLSESAMR